jgi:uncharacterized protein with GYD domain
MSTYITHFAYTPAAWAKLIDNPADRTAAVRSTVADTGGTLQSLHFTADDLAGVALFDAPNEETATAVSMIITGSGAFTSVRTQRLLTGAELVTALTQAQGARAGYVRPGEQE